MAPPSYFSIAGGTGRQGSAVVNALLQDRISPINPEQIFVLTRNLEGPSAVKLAARGVSLVPGTLGGPERISGHLRDSGARLDHTVAFLAQAHGPTELEDARKFINTAVVSGLRYFVYSSVDRCGKELSDRDLFYCKKFSDKFHIEKHLISVVSDASQNESKPDKPHMDYTILRPLWFADNALWGFSGKLCMIGWRENLRRKSMQVVVSKDLGRWAVEALLRPDEADLRNNAVSLVSDKVSFQEVDEIYRQEIGKPVAVTYGWLARFVIWTVEDLRTMSEFIDEREYGADLVSLGATLKPTTFREWVWESTRGNKGQ